MSGSSPLARGLLRKITTVRILQGIIPARAGFTGSRSKARRAPGDHPRSRGVYRSEGLRAHLTAGSSPLARGLLPVQSITQSVNRIIPARAGFTSPRSPLSPLGPDHPRSRGVYLREYEALGFEPGSSPLARGLHPSQHKTGRGDGIIPARAGFTVTPFRTTRPSRDHPRSRGVYSPPVCDVCASGGSSPLARGLPGRCTWLWCLLGIIPARAGFTMSASSQTQPSPDHPRSRGVYRNPYLPRGA